MDFHSLVLSLTRVYLETVGNEVIRDEKALKVLELSSKLRNTSLMADSDEPSMCNVSLVKAGLEVWRKNSYKLRKRSSLKMKEE